MGRRRFTPLAAVASVVVLALGACGGSTPASAPASVTESAPAATGSVAPSIAPSTAKPGQIINVNGKDHIVGGAGRDIIKSRGGNDFDVGN